MAAKIEDRLGTWMLDYTDQGRRPSTRQIITDWKKLGKPRELHVAYGETDAVFTYYGGRFHDYGNGCSGVKRDQVVKALNLEIA